MQAGLSGRLGGYTPGSMCNHGQTVFLPSAGARKCCAIELLTSVFGQVCCYVDPAWFVYEERKQQTCYLFVSLRTWEILWSSVKWCYCSLITLLPGLSFYSLSSKCCTVVNESLRLWLWNSWWKAVGRPVFRDQMGSKFIMVRLGHQPQKCSKSFFFVVAIFQI